MLARDAVVSEVLRDSMSPTVGDGFSCGIVSLAHLWLVSGVITLASSAAWPSVGL